MTYNAAASFYSSSKATQLSLQIEMRNLPLAHFCTFLLSATLSKKGTAIQTAPNRAIKLNKGMHKAHFQKKVRRTRSPVVTASQLPSQLLGGASKVAPSFGGWQ